MKCTVCREPAVIDIRRHNAYFCPDHFLRLCRDQTAKAIKDHQMFGPDDRVLVAVSGGKDSLAVWDILLELGYRADGFVIGLGIGDYSAASTQHARDYATGRGATLLEVNLPDEYGYDIPSGSKAARRTPCSACGLTKRHLFDRAAVDGGYDVVVTGHNLDDEAAVLFGNVLHWHTEYLGRQSPVLPARAGFPRKAKPLIRLGEREMAAYCVLKGIDYIVEECPMAAGNRHLQYKESLNSVEARSPGAKFDFYHRFLTAAAPAFRIADEDDTLSRCERCGAPCSAEVCAFCRLVERATTPQPVHLGPRRRRGAANTATTTDRSTAEGHAP